VNIATLAAKNLLRNKFRTILTLLAVMVTVLAFLSLRTVISSWHAGVDHAAKDRIGTRNKVTFIMPLPRTFVDKVRANVDRNGQPLGVTDATWANWFGGKNPKAEKEFFATLATDPESMLRVYDEISVPEDQKQAWLANRRGVLVGDVLARKFGWKPGDKVNLEGTIFPGTWEFEISGIYTVTRRSLDRSTFWFHWEYLNDSVKGPNKDKIGWIISRIDDPKRSADISKNIDLLFEDGADQTLTMSERQMNLSFMGMFTAILTAIDIVSLVLLLIMMLILGNTIAMAVRERTNEYGVMRAIGFLPRHLAIFIIGESAFVALLGGLLGVGFGYTMINFGMGPALEENMGGFFPYFRVAPETVVLALGLSVLLGILGAAIPGYRASKLNVIDAIRRVG
jgi:putative ABC transport system permease protein